MPTTGLIRDHGYRPIPPRPPIKKNLDKELLDFLDED